MGQIKQNFLRVAEQNMALMRLHFTIHILYVCIYLTADVMSLNCQLYMHITEFHEYINVLMWIARVVRHMVNYDMFPIYSKVILVSALAMLDTTLAYIYTYMYLYTCTCIYSTFPKKRQQALPY